MANAIARHKLSVSSNGLTSIWPARSDQIFIEESRNTPVASILTTIYLESGSGLLAILSVISPAFA